MPDYDIFFENKHPLWAQRFLIWCNRALLRFIRQEQNSSSTSLRVLEVGPGKGYFYQACVVASDIEYVACDRNPSFGRLFPGASFYECEIPSFPMNIGTFDVIYAGYVIEHLSDGMAVAEFFRSCEKMLSPGGVIVIACPDALSQQFEFFNMDYTHRYPTTERNVSMAFSDSGFLARAYPLNGLLTVPGFSSRLFFVISRAVLFFYNYRLMHFCFGWVGRRGIADLQNPFYQFYCFAKQRNILFLAKRIP